MNKNELYREYCELSRQFFEDTFGDEWNEMDDSQAYPIIEDYLYKFKSLAGRMADALEDLEDRLETYKAIHIG